MYSKTSHAHKQKKQGPSPRQFYPEANTTRSHYFIAMHDVTAIFLDSLTGYFGKGFSSLAIVMRWPESVSGGKKETEAGTG